MNIFNMILRKNLSYLLLPLMIMFSLQSIFAKTIDYRSPIADYTAKHPVPSANCQQSNIQHSTLNIDENPFRFSSSYYDSESGLYYLHARYYSPELMRFINRDSYDLSNRYAYCNADPISNSDPSGHFTIPDYVNDSLAGIGVLGAFATAFITAGSGACFGVALFSALSGAASLSMQVESGRTKGNVSRELAYASSGTGLLSAAADLIDITCIARCASRSAKESVMIRDSLGEPVAAPSEVETKLEKLHASLNGRRYNQYCDMDKTLNTHASYFKMYKFDPCRTKYAGSIVEQLNRDTGGTTSILTHGYFNKGKLGIFSEFGISRMDAVYDSFDVASGEGADKFATIERLQMNDTTPALLIDNDEDYMTNASRVTSRDLYYYNPVSDKVFMKAAENTEWAELFAD